MVFLCICLVFINFVFVNGWLLGIMNFRGLINSLEMMSCDDFWEDGDIIKL